MAATPAAEDGLRRHEPYMRRCIELARRARESGDTPVGALVRSSHEVVGEGVEAVKARQDVTAHAEIEALRAACERLSTLDLTGCTLYTSVEPCVMCAYAIRLARVTEVVIGAPSDGPGQTSGGQAVLAAGEILPGRRPPAVVRDVLRDECLAVLADRNR